LDGVVKCWKLIGWQRPTVDHSGNGGEGREGRGGGTAAAAVLGVRQLTTPDQIAIFYPKVITKSSWTSVGTGAKQIFKQ
jgi:hypothetical protein